MLETPAVVPANASARGAGRTVARARRENADPVEHASVEQPSHDALGPNICSPILCHSSLFGSRGPDRVSCNPRPGSPRLEDTRDGMA